MSDVYLSSLGGGLLIGLAASMLLLFNGRLAGISTIIGGLWTRHASEAGWRFWFIGGLLLGGVSLDWLEPGFFEPSPFPAPVLAVSGLLAGLGASLGNGCTSGHGICGLARRSLRSLVATLCFMASAIVTVFLARQGGLLS